MLSVDNCVKCRVFRSFFRIVELTSASTPFSASHFWTCTLLSLVCRTLSHQVRIVLNACYLSSAVWSRQILNDELYWLDDRKLSVTIHLSAAHRRTCQGVASLSPVLTLGGICVLTLCSTTFPDSHSTLTAVGPHARPGILPEIYRGLDDPFQTFTNHVHVCLILMH